MSTQTGVSGITFGDGTTQNTASFMAAAGVVQEYPRTIAANYTMTASRSGLAVGPITINTGVTATIPSGCRLVIL